MKWHAEGNEEYSRLPENESTLIEIYELSKQAIYGSTVNWIAINKQVPL